MERCEGDSRQQGLCGKGRSILETDSDNQERAEKAARERAEVDRLLAELERASQGRYPVFNVGCLIALGSLLGMFSLCGAVNSPLVGLVALFCGGLFLLLLGRLTVSARQKELLIQLRSFRDVHLVGPLLTTLYWPGLEEHRYSAQIALIALLPQMRASDAGLLNRDQRLILYRTLRSGEEPFVLAILKALEQIGTAEAIPYVERLVRRRVWTPGQKKIKEAAEACLSTLHAHTSRTGERLLRPATTPASPEETLLRPASTGTGEAETLLRPDESGLTNRPIDTDIKERRMESDREADGDTNAGDQKTE
jgi:hypothetical protein